MADRVLVTGGSGYIAGFLIRQLVAEGWTVHTTVRDLAKEAAVRRLLAVDDSRLHVFAADLNADAGWAEAAAGCSHVAHLASPLPAGVPRHPDELIVPARDGALRALRAARAAGATRFVMTSSVAAIAYGRGRGVHHFTEADWTQLDKPGLTPYVRSKTIAERAARDWVAAEGAGLEFCTINPSVVLGPVWSRDYSASVVIVRKLLDGSVRACPNFGFGIVDVRDVADHHIRAMTNPAARGERFLSVAGNFMRLIRVSEALRQGLGERAKKAPTRELPNWMVRLAALRDSGIKQFVPELGKVRNATNEKSRRLLGWSPRSPEDAIVATGESLLRLGLVTG